MSTLKTLITPKQLQQQLPITDTLREQITQSRQQVRDIVMGEDHRLLVIVGPCSIHDPKAALEYGKHLKKAAEKYKEELCLVMRVYFEKPRTSLGWKGLINDPNLDNSFDINHGFTLARQLLLELNQLGIATATEFLDTISPQYINDLISWGAIGARTTESQLHRELASGLAMPIGFKNGTDGNIQIAIDALRAAANTHHFLSINPDGVAAIIHTEGNQACHVILRGASTGPNYQVEHVAQVMNSLRSKDQNPRIMIDCSHGNSGRVHTRQKVVATDIANQIKAGNHYIIGTMIESHLKAGKQKLDDGTSLTYGQSITDACIAWEDTLPLLNMLAEAVKEKRSF